MNKKVIVASVAAGVALGIIATPAPDAPKPETRTEVKFIHGPTKYITKKVPEKVITEKYGVVVPMPSSCQIVIDHLASGAKESNGVYNNAKTFFEYIDHVQLREIQDPSADAKIESWLADRKEKVRENMQSLAEDVERLQTSWVACQKAVKEAQQDAENTASRY